MARAGRVLWPVGLFCLVVSPVFAVLVLATCMGVSPSVEEKLLLMDRVEHYSVDNGGVNIHYVAVGEGPVLLFVHGWPDFWYLWHNQIEGLSDSYRRVAMDMRGTNLSDAPEGVEHYAMKRFTSDINAVIEDVGAESVIQVPVLQFHGLADLAVHESGLAGTWGWVDGDYTLVTYPGVGHIPHVEVPDRVTTTIRSWLGAH